MEVGTEVNMKTKKFKIPLFEVEVIYIETESKQDASEVERLLKRYALDKNNISIIKENVELNRYNGGNHFFNALRKRSIIFLYRQTSETARRMTLGHERRHLEDRVLELTNINDIETAGLLSGYISSKLY